MLQSPENGIARRNVRTVKIPLSNFIDSFGGSILFKCKRRRRKRRVKRQLAFKQGEKNLKYDIQL